MSRDALYYETHGNAACPRVLFLHGFMGSSADWRDVARRIEDACYCICPDLPGHGRSVGLEGTYSMERTAALLGAVLDKEAIDSAHVVGYSMGGRTGLYFAVMHPERCRSLILESASPGLQGEADREARRGIDEARAVRIESGDFLEFLAEWYRQPLFETYQRQKGLLERMIRSRERNDPGELARSLRGMGTGSQPSLWDSLGDLDIPVLACAGAVDGAYVETAERMALMMPRARSTVLPNAGHNLHVEKPTAFAELVMDFLRKPT